MKKIISLLCVACLAFAVACSDDKEVDQAFDSVLTPDFTFDDSEEIIAGVDAVQFIDNSKAEGTEISGYFWHFGFAGLGNWSEDAVPNPVMYKDAGEYTVTLTVYGADGNSRSTKRTIVVKAANLAPSASFSYTPETVVVDTEVTFTDTSVDSDGEIVARRWTLPDNTTSTDASVKYTFTKGGTFSVTLRVTDDRGASSEVSKTVYVAGGESSGSGTADDPWVIATADRWNEIAASINGSGEFASNIEDQIRLLSDKWPRARYLAYFQNHTNTYAPVAELRKKYEAVLANPKIEGLVIGTRPDCLSEEVLDLLSEINRSHFLWLELGLQTIHEETARAINRCYDLPVFDRTMAVLREREIRTVVHLILGLPGEDRQMMLDSVRYVAAKPELFGMKLHLLNIVKGSQMEYLYPDYQPFASIDDYVCLVCDCLELIPPEVTMHRLTGDAPRGILINPPWSFNKRTILNGINDRLYLLDSWQGKRCR